MIGEIIGPRGESTTIILLSGQSIKLSPDFIFLYVWISTALGPHQVCDSAIAFMTS